MHRTVTGTLREVYHIAPGLCFNAGGVSAVISHLVVYDTDELIHIVKAGFQLWARSKRIGA